MFALLLVPGVQQTLQVILDNTLDVAQIILPEFAFASYFDRVKPEFRLISFFSHMNVRRLICYICFIEKEFVAVHAKNDRHGISNG